MSQEKKWQVFQEIEFNINLSKIEIMIGNYDENSDGHQHKHIRMLNRCMDKL